MLLTVCLQGLEQHILHDYISIIFQNSFEVFVVFDFTKSHGACDEFFLCVFRFIGLGNFDGALPFQMTDDCY